MVSYRILLVITHITFRLRIRINGGFLKTSEGQIPRDRAFGQWDRGRGRDEVCCDDKEKERIMFLGERLHPCHRCLCQGPQSAGCSHELVSKDLPFEHLDIGRH